MKKKKKKKKKQVFSPIYYKNHGFKKKNVGKFFLFYTIYFSKIWGKGWMKKMDEKLDGGGGRGKLQHTWMDRKWITFTEAQNPKVKKKKEKG